MKAAACPGKVENIDLPKSPSILYRADNISNSSLHFEKSKE
jgi:hypothetical protein